MNKEVLNFINHQIIDINDELKILSSKKNKIYDVYKIVSGKKEIPDVEKLRTLLNRPKVLEKCLEEVYIMDDFGLEQACGTINSYIEYFDYKKDISELEKRNNISALNGASTEFIRKNILLSKRPELLNFLINLQENDRKIEETYKVTLDLLIYIISRIISEYESVFLKRESLKSKLKVLKQALTNIDKEERLSAIEISSLMNLVQESDYELNEKNMLLEEINNYIIKIKDRKKDKIIKPEVTKEETKTTIVYIDDVKEDIIEKQPNKLLIYENYLAAIKSFDDFDSVNTFLNSIKDGVDINLLIDKVVTMLDDSDKDNLLKQYLLLYKSKIKEEPLNNESKDDINILYYGFMSKRNYVLDDLKDIANTFYKDVSKGLEIIKENKITNKSVRVTSIKKVLKLRINDIRITYRRINSNTYIIYGVFHKDDNKGMDVIETTRARNKYFINNEEHILKEALENDFIKEKYLEKNAELDLAISQKLEQRIK